MANQRIFFWITIKYVLIVSARGRPSAVRKPPASGAEPE
jgi:hypothetical protein